MPLVIFILVFFVAPTVVVFLVLGNIWHFDLNHPGIRPIIQTRLILYSAAYAVYFAITIGLYLRKQYSGWPILVAAAVQVALFFAILPVIRDGQTWVLHQATSLKSIQLDFIDVMSSRKAQQTA